MRTSRMIWTGIVVVLVALVALLGVGYGVLNAGDKAPQAGSVAPDFTLNSEEGTPVSLHDYRGKWVVLYFYPKDFTSGCTTEAHNFQRDLAQYQAKGVTILGVSADTADSHKKFCAQEGLNFKLLSDSDHKVSEEYGSIMNLGVKKLSARHTFIISPDGVIVQKFLDVNPSKHSEEVLAALTELQKT
ncbi:MAG TPA: peroxiredoxin [Candidatus Acidoferrales bacterium]|jgi:thioredoxin-dependent peroxiredoxin|nr:peroxiredoxin [Candidatus Acidoferrales bacterium]